MEDLDLAALLSTRICHDLVGPVGALGNGVELLAEEDGADLREQALDLLGMSAEQASRRLRFFRLACGTMKWGDEPMDEGEARAAAAGMLEAGRTTLDWPAGGVAGLTQGRARALLNLVLVAAECLPSSGEVRVGPGAGGGTELAATGSGARLDEAIADALVRGIPTRELESRAAPARLAQRQLAVLGARLDQHAEEGKIAFAVSWP